MLSVAAQSDTVASTLCIPGTAVFWSKLIEVGIAISQVSTIEPLPIYFHLIKILHIIVPLRRLPRIFRRFVVGYLSRIPHLKVRRCGLGCTFVQRQARSFFVTTAENRH